MHFLAMAFCALRLSMTNCATSLARISDEVRYVQTEECARVTVDVNTSELIRAEHRLRRSSG